MNTPRLTPQTKSTTMHPRALIILFFSTSLLAAEPEKLTKLRGGYEAAVAKVTAPIQKTYANELEKLKSEFTRAGNLEAALAVDTELKSLSTVSASPSKSVVPAASSVRKSLSKKELEALHAALLGSWRLPNGSFGKFSSVWILGGERSVFSVDRYGEITINNAKGDPAKLRMTEDLKTSSGTWYDKTPIELKKIN
jgi:hypothetical protein